MKRILPILAACILLTLAAACRSSKKAVSDNATVVNTVSPRLSTEEFRIRLSEKIASQGNWEYVKMPVTVKLRKPKDMSIGGTAWMQRDSSIVISLRYMGFEVGSMSMTVDSVVVIDKLHKSYMAERLDKFLDGMNFDLANLQDMLLGRTFRLGQKSMSAADLNRADIDTDEETGRWIMVPAGQPNDAGYGFCYSSTASLVGMSAQSGQRPPVNIIYNGSTETPAGIMAKEVSVTAMAGKTPIDASLMWNFDKAKWDDPSQHRTVRPGKNYKRLDPSQISLILKKL